MSNTNLLSHEDAKALGLKRFFTGEPCNRGHICERYVAGQGDCVKCASERNKRRWATDEKYREARLRKQKRRYRDDHEYRIKMRYAAVCNAGKNGTWAGPMLDDGFDAANYNF